MPPPASLFYSNEEPCSVLRSARWQLGQAPTFFLGRLDERGKSLSSRANKISSTPRSRHAIILNATCLMSPVDSVQTSAVRAAQDGTLGRRVSAGSRDRRGVQGPGSDSDGRPKQMRPRGRGGNLFCAPAPAALLCLWSVIIAAVSPATNHTRNFTGYFQ